MAHGDQLLRELEVAGYYAVVRAFVAGGKLNFDTEPLLGDLQKALNIDDDTSTDLLCKADEDEEATILKQYDNSIVAAPAAHAPALKTSGSGRPLPSILPATSGYAADPTYVQPAKKPKKAQPAAQQPMSAPRGSRQGGATGGGGGGSSRSKARSTPATPAGGGAPSSTPRTHSVKAPKPPKFSQAALDQLLAKGGQAEWEAYAQEVSMQEREIFTELIALKTSESHPSLNDAHKALLEWYRLDAREAAIEQELAGLGHTVAVA